jgi:hypothetical protein
MTITRLTNNKRLADAVQQAKAELENYLKSARYIRAYGIEEIQHIDQDFRYTKHPTIPNKYICLPNSYRNKRLTEERVSLVLSAVSKIQGVLDNAPTDLTPFELSDRLNTLRVILTDNANQNVALSKIFKKHHCTFKQAGSHPYLIFGNLSILWRITFFQSRCTKAFEKSLQQVDDISNQIIYKIGRMR